jgi:lipopolysaccharide export system permease protein
MAFRTMLLIDRYIMKLCLRAFAFFTLVFLGLMLLQTTLKLFDEIVLQGHQANLVSGLLFLSIPTLLTRSIPLAAFAASVIVAHRLNNDSEFTIFSSSGISAWRILRAFFYFGFVAFILMLLLTTYLKPMANAKIAERKHSIANSLGPQLFKEGEFQHPTSGVTTFIGDTNLQGELLSVSIFDNRDPSLTHIYTANTAKVIKDEQQLIFVLNNGLIQSFKPSQNNIAITTFSELTFDLSVKFTNDFIDLPAIDQLPTMMLIRTPDVASKLSKTSVASVVENLHERINTAVLSLVVSLVGFSMLYIAGFSRFGSGRYIAIAIFTLIVLKLVEGATVGVTYSEINYWPLLYSSSVLGILIVFASLFVSLNYQAFVFRNKELGS